MSVLLPEPLTPVTSTRRPSGKPMVRFLRLFLFAFCKVSQSRVEAPESLMAGFEERFELSFAERGVLNSDCGVTGRRLPRVG